MLVMVINKQKRLMWLPNVLLMRGMYVSHSTIASYEERSLAQRNDSPRNSIEEGKNENIATRMGICNNIGKQPPIGFTPALL